MRGTILILTSSLNFLWFSAKAQEGEEEEDDDEESDIEAEVLSSDEDEIDEVGNEYLEKLQERVTKKANNNAFSVNAQLQVRAPLLKLFICNIHGYYLMQLVLV